MTGAARTEAMWRVAKLGLGAGLAGTTAMTITTSYEQRLRPRLGHPVDYDASDAPVVAASTLLHLHPHTRMQRDMIFAALHWGYGSLVGVGFVLMSRRFGMRPVTVLMFFGGVQGMALTLLPILGGTPPPWRWRRDVLASSLLQHAVYATATGVAARMLASATRRAVHVRRARRPTRLPWRASGAFAYVLLRSTDEPQG